MLSVGAAFADITPSKPLPLAGFGHRLGPFEGVSRPIKVRAVVFERDGVRAAIVSADLVTWSPQLVAALRRGLEQEIGVTPERLLLHVTHTHCGPQVSSIVSLNTPPDPTYVAELEQLTLDAVRRAAVDLTPTTGVSLGHSTIGFSINRRLWRDGQIVMAPNPDGPTDPVVTAVTFRRDGGRPPVLLVHCTCHPTTSDQTRVSPDYAGGGMDLVEADLGEGAVSVFLQGCCGDIRPALVRDGSFYRGTQEDVDRLAGELATAVRAASEGQQTPLADTPLEGRLEVVELPYAPLPETAALEALAKQDGSRADWAHYLLANPDWRSGSVPLEITRLTLRQGLSLVSLNAEPVVSYGFTIRELSGGTALPLGYSHALVGYLPTAAQLSEGGYEATTSYAVFGRAAPFAPAAEQVTVDGIRAVLDV